MHTAHRFRYIFLLVLIVGLAACQSISHIQLLAINDVYEISPLANGTAGGMARVATLRKQLEAQNPDTYFLLAGDFVSPSVIGTLRHEGRRIAGKQMVEVLNTAGLDYTAFGNHEFDIDEADLQSRLNESDFTWIAGNVRHKTAQGVEPFYQERNNARKALPNSIIIQTKNAKIGVISACINTDKGHVAFEEMYESAKQEYDKLLPQTDFIIALTHLEVGMDMELARRLPGLKLIMGGHEHENMKHQVGQTIICKADANVKTAYVHHIRFNPKTKAVDIRSELKKIDSSLPDDMATALAVSKWTQIADASFRAQGFDPKEVVAVATEPWDGLEASVRNQPTNLSTLIAEAIKASCPDCEAAIYNSGSIRIDDKLQGNITQYDVVRILPFGGSIVKVKLAGGLLLRTLNAGRKNKGIGGYLQHANIAYNAAADTWTIGGKPIDVAQDYTIATTDFLISGKEFNLGFFNANEPGVKQVDKPADNDPLRGDLRRAFIAYLKAKR